MKNIQPKLVKLFKEGYCTPQIARIAKKLKEPSTTIHYNIKKLEEKSIKTYKAVFDYKSIQEGFCVFMLIKLAKEEYGTPEETGKKLLNYDCVESVNIITGGWEMIVKARFEDQDKYYEFMKSIIKGKGISEIRTLTSLKEMKTEFIICS